MPAPKPRRGRAYFNRQHCQGPAWRRRARFRRQRFENEIAPRRRSSRLCLGTAWWRGACFSDHDCHIQGPANRGFAWVACVRNPHCQLQAQQVCAERAFPNTISRQKAPLIVVLLGLCVAAWSVCSQAALPAPSSAGVGRACFQSTIDRPKVRSLRFCPGSVCSQAALPAPRLALKVVPGTGTKPDPLSRALLCLL